MYRSAYSLGSACTQPQEHHITRPSKWTAAGFLGSQLEHTGKVCTNTKAKPQCHSRLKARKQTNTFHKAFQLDGLRQSKNSLEPAYILPRLPTVNCSFKPNSNSFVPKTVTANAPPESTSSLFSTCWCSGSFPGDQWHIQAFCFSKSKPQTISHEKRH